MLAPIERVPVGNELVMLPVVVVGVLTVVFLVVKPVPAANGL